MENIIKECKSGFNISYASSSSMIVNANRVQIHALPYNLFVWFRRLTMRKIISTPSDLSCWKLELGLSNHQDMCILYSAATVHTKHSFSRPRQYWKTQTATRINVTPRTLTASKPHFKDLPATQGSSASFFGRKLRRLSALQLSANVHALTTEIPHLRE